MARTPARQSTGAKSGTRRAPAKKNFATHSSARRHVPTPVGVSDRDHLISVIRESAGCSKGAARKTLDDVVATIAAALKKNQKVQLVGFGSFEVTKRPARKGRNPRTGESIRVKASKSVRFKAGQKLRRSV